MTSASILDTIRTVETGGNYQTRIATATASGAYAFIDSSWQYFARQAGIDTTQYPSAWMAPPPEQDAAAAVYVNELLARPQQPGRRHPRRLVSAVRARRPELMDQVPYPQAGNNLTIRQYQLKWMNVYHQKLAAAAPGPDGINANCSTSITADGQWALPAPRDVLANAGIDSPTTTIRPSTDDARRHPRVRCHRRHRRPHHPLRRQLVARRLQQQNPPDGCATCGMGITIHTADGLRHTYCHNSVMYVHDGAPSPPASTSPTPVTPAAPAPPICTSRSGSTTSSTAPNSSSKPCTTTSRRPAPPACPPAVLLLMPAMTPALTAELRHAATMIRNAIAGDHPADPAAVAAAHNTFNQRRLDACGDVRDAIDHYLDDDTWQHGPHMLRSRAALELAGTPRRAPSCLSTRARLSVACASAELSPDSTRADARERTAIRSSGTRLSVCST